MLRRHHIAALLALALVLGAVPAAASGSRLQAGMVPSPSAGAGAVHARVTGGASPYATATLPSGGADANRPPSSSPPRVPQVPVGAGARDIPRAYLRRYRSTARHLGVDWRVLAAIGKIESDHGRSTAAGVRSGLNFAACCSGPMQICTVASCGRVWQHYAVDANGDGRKSVYEPADSIAAAGGIVRDLQTVFGHNHPGLLLAAYNAGPTAVQRAKGVPDYPETRSYVTQGLDYMRSLRGKR